MFTAVLYALGAFFGLFGLWSLIILLSEIGEIMTANGLTFSGHEYDVISYLVQGCGAYFVYCAVMLGLGRAILLLTGREADEADDDDFDGDEPKPDATPKSKSTPAKKDNLDDFTED